MSMDKEKIILPLSIVVSIGSAVVTGYFKQYLTKDEYFEHQRHHDLQFQKHKEEFISIKRDYHHLNKTFDEIKDELKEIKTELKRMNRR